MTGQPPAEAKAAHRVRAASTPMASESSVTDRATMAEFRQARRKFGLLNTSW